MRRGAIARDWRPGRGRACRLVRRRRPRGQAAARRERMPQAGMLLQVDGSRHDWLEGRGPWLTLVGGIDDATGLVTGAIVPRAGGRRGLPRDAHPDGPPLRPAAGRSTRDRHGIFWKGPEPRARRSRSSSPGEARRRSWARPSRPPPSPGWPPAAPRPRVASSGSGAPPRTASSSSCVWRERRYARGGERSSSPPGWPRHNARFAVAAADPGTAWRPLPGGRPEELFCFRHARRGPGRHVQPRRGEPDGGPGGAAAARPPLVISDGSTAALGRVDGPHRRAGRATACRTIAPLTRGAPSAHVDSGSVEIPNEGGP